MLNLIVFEGVQNLPIFAAQQQGYFQDAGLDVSLEFTPNSWTLRDELAAGRYQIAHAAVDNAIAMHELANQHIAIFLGGDNGFNAVVSQPDVASLDALRGRTVLVDAPNTAFALVMYRILSQRGMQRDDYTVESVGATPLRLARMLDDRSAAASIMNLPFRLQAEDAGLKIHGEAVDFIGPYLSTAGFAMTDWAAANHDTLRRYIRAYIQGLRWALQPEHAEAAIALLAQRLKLTPALARRGYQMAASPDHGLSRDARLDIQGLENVLRLRASVEQQWDGTAPAVERYVDLRHYDAALAELDG